MRIERHAGPGRGTMRLALQGGPDGQAVADGSAMKWRARHATQAF